MHPTNLLKGITMTDPTENIKIGDEATIQKEVTFDNTIAAKAIKDALPDGWISVGTSVNVRHLAPTPVGSIVTSTAKVIATSGVTVTFEVTVHDGVEVAGSGT